MVVVVVFGQRYEIKVHLRCSILGSDGRVCCILFRQIVSQHSSFRFFLSASDCKDTKRTSLLKN